MKTNDDTASEIAEICLTKCGFVRNLQPILEALEEQIYGNGGALNADDFETSEDYANMRYSGMVSTSLDLIRDGVVNRNLDCQFTDAETHWLNDLSIEGRFRINTMRRDYAVHDIHIVLDVPISPTKSTTEKIRLSVRLKDTEWNSSKLSINARTNDEDVDKASKVLTLYLLS